MIRLVKIVAFIGALAFVAGAVFDHDPEFDLKVARNAFLAGDMDSAMRLARMAALLAGRDSGEWGSAQVLIARASRELNRSDRAMRVLDRLLAAQPGHPTGLQLRGELKLRDGDAPGALDDLDQSRKLAAGSKAAPLSKSQAPAIAKRAQAYLKVGRQEEAGEDARTAYELDPKHPDVLYTMSLVAESRKQFGQGLQDPGGQPAGRWGQDPGTGPAVLCRQVEPAVCLQMDSQGAGGRPGNPAPIPRGGAARAARRAPAGPAGIRMAEAARP